MGNASGKTDRRIPSIPHFVGEFVAFACCCRERRTLMVQERREKPSNNIKRAEEDLFFLLAYKRTKPRSILSKVGFGLSYFFLELCPTVCCPPCPAAIIHKLAFRPPERPTYNFTQFGGKEDMRIDLRSAGTEFLRLRYPRCRAYSQQLRCFYTRQKPGGPRIACVYARAFSSLPETETLTLLYSHNNGIDVGLLVGYIVLMSRRFRVNVFAYDYAGYGRSTGHCSEASLYQSAEAAYEFLTTQLAVPPEQIIAIGTSLGTAATIHLASSNRRLKGVVLQGGFLSALRVVCPDRTQTCRMDRFVNVDKIERVQCPTLVVHGKNDKLFSVAHAQTLRRRCPGASSVQPLLIDYCGHIEFDDFPVYWQRIHKFLHVELTKAATMEGCCSYHHSEVVRRQSGRSKSMMTKTVKGI